MPWSWNRSDVIIIIYNNRQAIVNKDICIMKFPKGTTLRNYSTPFNPETRMKFETSNATPVQIKVYDILGKGFLLVK